MPTPLDRFTRAQDDPITGFSTALTELRAGRKRSHWIWYIFPQLAGLGSSPMAAAYGLDGVDDAIAYLEHPLLRGRLLAVTEAAAEQVARHVRVRTLMGSDIDARKLVSCMTLFEALVRRYPSARPVADTIEPMRALRDSADVLLRAAAEEGLPRCTFTVDRLRQAGWA